MLQYHPGDRVSFSAGEYAGNCGRIESIVQKRYSREATTYRVQIDGFPKPGGWNGLVSVTGDVLTKCDLPLDNLSR